MRLHIKISEDLMEKCERLPVSQLKTSWAPGPLGILGPDRATQKKKIWSRSSILLNPGDGLVLDLGNGSGRERGSFLLVWVFFYSLGLNFVSSKMIYTWYTSTNKRNDDKREHVMVLTSVQSGQYWGFKWMLPRRGKFQDILKSGLKIKILRGCPG